MLTKASVMDDKAHIVFSFECHKEGVSYEALELANEHRPRNAPPIAGCDSLVLMAFDSDDFSTLSPGFVVLSARGRTNTKLSSSELFGAWVAFAISLLKEQLDPEQLVLCAEVVRKGFPTTKEKVQSEKENKSKERD